jgi:hypothetical protein
MFMTGKGHNSQSLQLRVQDQLSDGRSLGGAPNERPCSESGERITPCGLTLSNGESIILTIYDMNADSIKASTGRGVTSIGTSSANWLRPIRSVELRSLICASSVERMPLRMLLRISLRGTGR